MELNLQPIKLNGKTKIESIKTAKYITLEGEIIPVTPETLQEIARAYFKKKKEEITQEKIDEFIKNF